MTLPFSFFVLLIFIGLALMLAEALSPRKTSKPWLLVAGAAIVFAAFVMGRSGIIDFTSP